MENNSVNDPLNLVQLCALQQVLEDLRATLIYGQALKYIKRENGSEKPPAGLVSRSGSDSVKAFPQSQSMHQLSEGSTGSCHFLALGSLAREDS